MKNNILIVGIFLLFTVVAGIIIVAILGLIGMLTGNLSGGTSSSNGGLCTSAQLSESLMDKINTNKAVYTQAADQAGVPWEFLAALHYRESTLSDHVDKDGPFQVQGSKNLDFNGASAIEAANHAKGAVKTVYGKIMTKSADDETVKLALLSYNRGSMYKSGGCTEDQSPYVMNNFDDSHQDMVWPNNSCEPPSTRGKTDGKLGGFAVYRIIKGCSLSSGAGGAGECTWKGNIENDPINNNIGSQEINVWKLSGGKKVSSKISVQVNNKCKEAIKKVFDQIYNDPSKPPIGDVGCYANRGNDWSRHNWGVACDVNVAQNWCKNCYGKSSGGTCGLGSSVGQYWKPGNISPDNSKKGWVVGYDEKSFSLGSPVVNAFSSVGWGRGLYRCYNDFMHFSVDGH